MIQCVPSWDVDGKQTLPAKRSHSSSNTPDVPMLDYEVAELTWENGQLSMHGLGQPRMPTKPISTMSTWEKPRGCGTLESIVNQATRLPEQRKQLPFNEFAPWFDHNPASAAATNSATMTMDALVPCSNRTEDHVSATPKGTQVIGTCMVGSCSGDAGKRPRVARDHSVSGSATIGRNQSQNHFAVDNCWDRDCFGGHINGFSSATSNFANSQDNTSTEGMPCTKTPTVTATATADENDSVCHSRSQREAGEEETEKRGHGKNSISTKRSRAAAIHNQSERKRRDKINQRMKTLQKLVPNSSKTDKASMLDEVIEYLKQLQAQVQMMSRMQPMMLPMAMQQQLQMSMMSPMSMGLGMGMGMAGVNVMDLNSMARSNMPLIHPSVFMSTPTTLTSSWDAFADKLPAAAASTVITDPLSAFLASQPMTMDAYSRMAAMYQQLQQYQQQPHQPPASSFKSQAL